MADQESSVAGLLREHVGLLASVGLFVMAAVKIFRVAGNDPATAAHLVQAGGPLSVTFGVVLASLPFFLLWLCVLASHAAIRTTGTTQAVLIVFLVVLVFIICFAAPVTILIYVAALGVGNAAGYFWPMPIPPTPSPTAPTPTKKRWHERLFEPPFADLINVATLLFLFIPTLFAMVRSNPWIPAERLTVKGSPTIVGYVIADAEGWTTVLTHEQRKLTLFRSDDVLGREVCYTDTTDTTRSAWQLLQGASFEPRYHTCWRPDASAQP